MQIRLWRDTGLVAIVFAAELVGEALDRACPRADSNFERGVAANPEVTFLSPHGLGRADVIAVGTRLARCQRRCSQLLSAINTSRPGQPKLGDRS